ncbi:WXG100 family type VII secretion target [Nakamurella silvestris]|nr:WXG100 family type VII secretion target [Nakamurella silvestris]
MANVNVTYDDLNNAASHLRTGQQEITDKLNELKGYISNLISNGYVTDQSSIAFGETFGNFTEGSVQTVAALDGLAGFLATAAQTLAEVDAQLAQSIRG